MSAPDPRLEEIEGRRSSEPCERHDWCAVSDIAYLLAELRKAQDKLARVEALAEKWRYKGEYGYGAWQEGYGPDHEGYLLDNVSGELRAAVADATGGGE